MKKKLRNLDVKKILSLTVSLVLILNLAGFEYLVQDVNAAVTAVEENQNRELTVNDIPDAKLFEKLKLLADANKDGKLIIAELENYPGDINGNLNLSNLSLTNIKGLGYAKKVKSINLSGNSSLTYIAERTFVDCENLISIILPDEITTIGDSAFDGCVSLKEINLPNGVTEIGASAFNQSTSLINIILPKMITNIGGSAFSGSGLISIEIPNPKVSIGVNCFNGSKDLRDVKLPEGLESIPVGAFAATGIYEINLPKTIKTIEAEAFSQSTLRKIDLSMNTQLTSIKASAFSRTPLSYISLPESLTEIGARVFENCSRLTEIKIPSKITVINDLTFSGCTSLERVIFTPTITGGVTSYNLAEIKWAAFNQCTSLGGESGNVDFLKNLNKLEKIGDEAFSYASGEKMKIKLDSEGNIVIDSKGNIIYEKVKDEYNQQVYYGIQTVILPENLTQLGKGVFSNCGSLKKITIPNKVTIIEDNTFLNCYNLEDVTLSNKLTTIGNNSFESCKALKSVEFPVSLKKIGSNTFLNAANEKVKTTVGENPEKEYVYTGIDKLILPDNLMDIGSGAFQGCFNINTVKLPANLTKLENNVFKDCGRQLRNSKCDLIEGSYIGIKSVEFPKELDSIGSSAFLNCFNLDLVEGKLPYTVSVIGANSFENCKSMTSIVIPSDVKSVGASTFSNCTSLKKVDFRYAANLEEIGATAFKNTNIEGIIRLPEKLKTIANGAFQGCKYITSVEFPDGLVSIGTLGFEECESLVSISIPSATTIINGSSASFFGCDSFSNAVVRPVPKDITLMENSQLELPINPFSEINSIEIGDENIAIAKKDINSQLKQQVLVNGIKEGKTTITINGTIQYIAGKDPVTGSTLVNRIQTKVEFNVIVSAKKCTEIIVEQPVRGLKLDNKAGIALKPIITPVDTSDLKKWTSDNPSVATVSDTGVVKAVNYGTAIIKLEVGDKEAEYTVNVCAPANSIKLDNSSATLVIGKSLSITETLNYSSAYIDIKTNYPDVVIWSSSNPNIATVDQSGNVKAIASGEAIITAKADGGNVTRSCSVTVIPEVTDVSFDKEKITLIKGNPDEITKTLTMTLNPADSPLSKIKVTSSNTSVASVSVKGNIVTVTARYGGNAVITATPINGKAAVCNVEVKSPLTSITTKPMDINKGSSRTISSVITPSDTTDKILYSSNRPEVAKVDENGKVTGIAGGVAIITIKSENGLVVTTCVVTVKVPVTGVLFTNKTADLIKNDKLQLGDIAKVQPSDATNKEVTWSSSNTSIAMVDEDGVVTAVGVGKAIITVKTVEYSYKATYTVNVTLPSIGDKPIDVNNDKTIDILDLALVAKGYDSQLGTTLYNEKLDFNSDKIIDIFDIIIVSKFID